MNGYVCFWRGKRVEVRADTTYAAQKEAAVILKVSERKQHEIAVVLAEKDGEQVTHLPTF